MLFVVSCGELGRGGRRSIHDTEVIIYIIDFKHIEAHWLSHSVTDLATFRIRNAKQGIMTI